MKLKYTNPTEIIEKSFFSPPQPSLLLTLLLELSGDTAALDTDSNTTAGRSRKFAKIKAVNDIKFRRLTTFNPA